MKKLVILFSLLIFFGCSNDDSKNEETQVQDPNATVADNVVVILAENSELISSESEITNGIYKIQFNESVPEIENNDIIVGNQGMGFLRRVASISTSGNLITIETTQANMEDVFGNTEINISTDLNNFDRSSSRNSSEQFAEGVSRNGFIFPLDNVQLFDNGFIDFKLESGSITYVPSNQMQIGFDLFSIDFFEYTETATMDFEAKYSLTSINSADIPFIDKELYSNSSTQVVWVSGIPIVVTTFFKLKAKAVVSFSGSNTLTKKFSNQTEIDYGIRYENDAWNPVVGFSSIFDNDPLEIETDYLTFNTSIQIVPETTTAFYGVNGPKTELPISSNFGLNFSPTMDWDAFLNLKVDLNFGVSMGIFGLEVLDLPLDTRDFIEENVWNAPDQIIIDETTNNQTGSQNEQLAEPLRVRVIDNTELVYLKEVPVYFEVIEGDGSLDSDMVLTDDNGYAEVNWTLGDNSNPQVVQATVKKADGTNIESIATFSANSEDNQTILVGTWQLFGENCTINTWSVTFFEDFTMNIENIGSIDGCTDNGNYSFDGTNLNFTYNAVCDDTSPIGIQNDSYSFTGSINSDNNFTGNLTLTDYIGPPPSVTNCPVTISN